MAFPASPSNNQVHKEGNKSFVWDSALGVWDQLQLIDEDEKLGGMDVPPNSGGLTTDELKLTPTTKPSNPVKGQLYYDSTDLAINVFNGKNWQELRTVTGHSSTGTGGLIQTYKVGGTTYRSHTFLTSGIFSTNATRTVNWLVVAGGGAGGNWHAGGGGAGGFMSGTNSVVGSVEYTITIGAGGAGGGTSVGSNGGNSIIFAGSTNPAANTVNGGGRGGKYGSTQPATGGSGAGGNGQTSYLTGAGSVGGSQGTAGGNGVTGHAGGGGGGAHGVGSLAKDSNSGGEGGHGKTNNYRDGTYQYYAGGGGGGTWGGSDVEAGRGGAGGGGRGSWSNNSGAPTSGEPNTGGGGGGNGGQGDVQSRQMETQGGSGIVVIRYTI